MAVDLRRPPVDVIHMPSVHGGMAYVGDGPDWIVRPVAGGVARMFAESEDAALRERQQATIDQQAIKLPRDVIEINACPVVLEDARFAHGLVELGGRFWMNGASGGRVRTRFQVQNTEAWRRERLIGAFRRLRGRGSLPLALCDPAAARDLPVAIELKNGFNYYHFVTESLGSLAHFLGDGSSAPITFHLPKGETKGFLRGFVDAVFPELAHRVAFVDRPGRYGRVRSVYSHQHYLYAVNDARVDRVLLDPDRDPRWEGAGRNPRSIKLAAMQSHDASLRLLRDAALAQAAAAGLAPMPRLIWMGRDERGAARSRGLEGHEPLQEALRARGFEMIAFEHLAPLEQIAAMQGADIVVAPHGAGLANMIFARPGALVIEIGTRQTQLHRWGDFLKCAHVSGCRYDTVFADVAGLDDPGAIPSMASGHRGVRIGRRAAERVVALVDEVLDQSAPAR